MSKINLDKNMFLELSWINNKSFILGYLRVTSSSWNTTCSKLLQSGSLVIWHELHFTSLFLPSFVKEADCKLSISSNFFLKSYVYWTVHHCDSWRKSDQLDVTSYCVLFHFFFAQNVSDINTSIIRSLWLFYPITTWAVCSCFDAWWSFGVAGLGLKLVSYFSNIV